MNNDQTITHCSDEQLVFKIQNHEQDHQEAFVELLLRHRQGLLSRCWLHLKNRADAEEAVQETQVRVFRNLQGYKGEASFRTWLYTIADNQCNTIHVRRSKHLLNDHLQSLIEIHQETQVYDENADETVIQQVREVMDDLPSQSRDVLMMRFHLELSLEEIAKNLGIGLSACKMRLYRAMAQFKEQFQASMALAA